MSNCRLKLTGCYIRIIVNMTREKLSVEKVSPSGIIYDPYWMNEEEVELAVITVKLNNWALDRNAPQLSAQLDAAYARARTVEQQDRILRMRDETGGKIGKFVDSEREKGNLNFL